MADETETPQGPTDENETKNDDNESETKGGPDETKRKRPKQSIQGRKVQVFGKKKHAIAIAICGDGFGIIRVNGKPLDLIEPKPLRLKVYEPLLLVGKEEFEKIDIHIRVRGGGPVAQIYGMNDII